jgi:hypothetical protein
MEARAAAATPGPWFVRLLDDEAALALVAVATIPDSGLGERYPEFDDATIVAATLVQHPAYAYVEDERWHENAVFIASARSDVPRLIAEIRRLRSSP